MLSLIDEMIDKFRININQILANSDNTIEDILSESFIVLEEYKQDIERNNNVFINELRKRCLKFNKYGKRIDSKKQWEIFNNREESMKYSYKNNLDIDEDLICSMITIKEIIGESDYNFLIFNYSHTIKETAKHYNLNESAVQRKVKKLVDRIKIHI